PRPVFPSLRPVLAPNPGPRGQDLRAMEDVLAASGLDWYALRPVKLTDGPPTGHVHASDRVIIKSISRADVAWHILTLAEDPVTHPQRTPVVTTSASKKSRPAGTGNLSAWAGAHR